MTKRLTTRLILGGLVVLCAGCGTKKRIDRTFQEDVDFLRQHTDVIVLKQGDSRVAIAPAYQGRVMTSTTSPSEGPSFGWLNYEVIQGGLFASNQAKGTLQDHIYVFGGEERFWLGPEGGQFAIFFKPKTEFSFDNWHTPASIDTLPYRVLQQTEDSVVFLHDCVLTNYSGTVLSAGIKRTIRVLDAGALRGMGMPEGPLPEGVHAVAYASENMLKNNGEEPWSAESGMLSIWLLGMYKPSPRTTVVIPVRAGAEKDLGPVVNDAYFGAIPSDYLRVTDEAVFLKADGTRRGKIGISPTRSRGVAGSYDAVRQVLTLVTYNVPKEYTGYVNSMWELQKEPFRGDAINAYNDGSPGPGLPPLGPFYEIETSSPAAALKPGEAIRHIQVTAHITGPESALDPIARAVLGVGISEIKAAFR